MSNRLYRFNSKKTWNDVFDEVADPDEIGMRKTDEVVVNVLDKSGLQTFEPDMSESIEVVQELVCSKINIVFKHFQRYMRSQ